MPILMADGTVLVQNMDLVFQWLKSGRVPKGGKKLHAIHGSDAQVEDGQAPQRQQEGPKSEVTKAGGSYNA